MKPYLLILTYWLLSIQSFAQNVTTTEEQDEIKQVIADEAKFFYARNADKWASCYRQTAQTYWACIEEDGTLQREGWDNIAPFVMGYIKDNPKPIKCTFKRENYNFRKVNPTYIWVTFDQTRTTAGKKDFSKETRIMELIKGEWKIVNMTGFWMPNEKLAKADSPEKGKEKKIEPEKSKKGTSEGDKKKTVKEVKKAS
ncbi:MAG: hypothetical protein MUF58_14160 [Arcicella sp.]|jgi:hypothetical protein|nr:hypothetical protein [Arcicella sp.]